jgi:1-acyl-sn-glycerol-3-phosphate acyltransferase
VTPLAAGPIRDTQPHAPSRPAGAAFRLRRAVRTAAIVGSLAVFALLAPVGYVGFALLARLWRRDPAERARRLQRVTGFGYRCLHDWLRWLRIVDFDPRTALSADLPRACIVVANHPTLIDVSAIGACLGGACTIVKPRIFRRRLLRPFMVGAGLIEGPGGDPISMGRVITEGVQRLRDVMRLTVFPEGTRSPPGGLRPFGRVAFEIACRSGVPVVCVGIRFQPIWLTREVPLLPPPDRTPELRLTLLGIEAPGAGGDSRELRARVEARYARWLGGA